MENFYKNCIFCGEELNKTERKGLGEHIIPRLLYGSITVKDVCKRCNNTFCAKADHLALEDERIIKAIRQLDLPKLKDKIRDRATGYVVADTDGSEHPIVSKNGILKTVTHPMPDGTFICDERDAAPLLLNILRKEGPHDLDQSEQKRIVYEELCPSHQQSKPGETIWDERIGKGLRNIPGRIHWKYKVTDRACERLAAKIGYEMAHLTLTREQRMILQPVLENLKATAMGKERIGERILKYCVSPSYDNATDSQGPRCRHRMSVECKDKWVFIEIYLFDCVGFRLRLHGGTQASLGAFKHPEGDLDMVGFLMTFEPGAEKKKYVFPRRVGCNEFEPGIQF